MKTRPFGTEVLQFFDYFQTAGRLVTGRITFVPTDNTLVNILLLVITLVFPNNIFWRVPDFEWYTLEGIAAPPPPPEPSAWHDDAWPSTSASGTHYGYGVIRRQ